MRVFLEGGGAGPPAAIPAYLARRVRGVMEVPRGAVTFLFTDVEGSTRLMLEHHDALGAALERHHRLLRDIIERSSGRVFETVGDAVYAAFARPSDAVAAAVEAQRALAAEEWGGVGELRVRMAIHTGEVRQRADGHYYGPSLFRTARLMIGHGGQVLVSAATAALLRDALGGSVPLRSLGPHRLKDLDEPEDVHQVVAEGLVREFPPLRSAEHRPTNLTTETTAFIGRDGERAELAALLRASRLVTVTGPGGTGKTRLAARVAADELDRFAQGVFFVDLAQIGEGALVLSAIALTLSLREAPGLDLRESVYMFLRDREVLIVLDNFEQVLSGAGTVADLLGACPRLRVLVTSRAPLHLRAEVEYPLAPLQLPARDADGRDPKVVEGADAVRFFVDRVRARDPRFTLDATSAAPVAEICRRLDGLPLALELAAGRIRALGVTGVLARLDRPMELLGAGVADLPPRQRTLRVTIDWSYRLLAPGLQRVFRAASDLSGAFDVAAVEAVAGVAAEDGVVELVDASLVRPEADGARPRFRMLATIREFGRERLADAGESASVAGRHAEHFRSLAETAEPHLLPPGRDRWLAELDLARDDLRQVLERARDATPGVREEDGVRICAALGWYWYFRSEFSAGRAWLRWALDRTSDDRVRAPLLYGAGILARYHGDYAQARELLDDAVAIRRRLGDEGPLAYALLYYGVACAELGTRDRREPALAEALALFERTGDRWGRAQALLYTGAYMALDLARPPADVDRAAELLREALATYRSLDDEWSAGAAVFYLGVVAQRRNDPAAATTAFGQALDLFERTGDRWRANLARRLRATLAMSRGDLAAAEGDLRAALELGRGYDSAGDIAAALNSLGVLEIETDRRNDATGHLREALTLAVRVGNAPLAARTIRVLAAAADDAEQTRRLVALARRVAPVEAAPGVEQRIAAAIGARADDEASGDPPLALAEVEREVERLWSDLAPGPGTSAG